MLTFAGRLLFVDEIPANWDAVQLALGIGGFNLAAHEPHPPGYILFILAGRLLTPIAGDPGIALSLISAIAATITVPLLVGLGTDLFDRRTGFVAGALYSTSPLAFYYGATGLTYAVEGMFATAAGWLFLRARRGESVAWVAGAFLLAIAAGFRPWTAVLLAPMCLWSAAAVGRRTRAFGTALFLMTVLAWAMPLVAMSGGPIEYLRASFGLGSAIAGATSAAAGLGAAGQNLEQLLLSTFLGVHLGLAFLAPKLFWRRSVQLGISREASGFLLWFTVPALVIFVAVHFGQPGYLLGMLSPLLLVCARGLVWFGDSLRSESLPLSRILSRLIPGFVVLSGLILFMFGPTSISAPALLEQRAFWKSLKLAMAAYRPDETVLLTGPTSVDSFRLASYELSGLDVRAVGVDRDGSAGQLFSNQPGSRRQPEFLAGGLAGDLVLSTSVRRLIVLDEDVSKLFDPAVGLRQIRITESRQIWVLEGKEISAGLALYQRPINVKKSP